MDRTRVIATFNPFVNQDEDEVEYEIENPDFANMRWICFNTMPKAISALVGLIGFPKCLPGYIEKSQVMVLLVTLRLAAATLARHYCKEGSLSKGMG